MLDDDGGQGALNSSSALPNAIADEDLGHAVLTPSGKLEAGSWHTFNLTYTCGKFGMDDSGSMRVCFRFASDQTRPQFEDPKRPNYTKIEASNSAVLEYRYDPKGNVRPWDRCLYIKVVKGFMQEGDTISITFGDTSGGSKGMRLQTFCEDTLEFRVLVDPIATANYQAIPQQPMIHIVPGPPSSYVAVVPTAREVNETFALKIRGEDLWGNPSDQCSGMFHVRSSAPVNGLPDGITFTPGEFSVIVDDLSIGTAGRVDIWLEDEAGNIASRANPIMISDALELKHYWVDLHGQSEETIGTGSARGFFEFARDKAFVDGVGHQGNDFQITKGFWSQLDSLCEEYDEPGTFLAPLGYEWSGNTALGGDRNIFFPDADRTIRRSSHALVEDKSDEHTDSNTAGELYSDITEAGEWDVVSYAHCGGRYADVKMAHDGRIEKSMEVHSSWGTFDWLLEDAFDMGYRTGIVANSDGHKGRPGASYPGASLFGAVGGLTCMMMSELTRDALFDCIRKRRHFCTTGGHGGRMFMDVRADFDQAGDIYNDDPALDYPTAPTSTPGTTALMGDIVELKSGGAKISVQVDSPAPIERVEIFNGRELVETIHPYTKDELGGRIRIHWEGAEYRGRFRQVIWDGAATVTDNTITSASGYNFFNPERGLTHVNDTTVEWMSLTTGNFAGADIHLSDAWNGTLQIETPLIKCGVPVEDIGYEDEVVDNSGVLPRFIKIFRMPDVNPHRHISFERTIDLADNRDNPIFIRVTQEDGVRAWSSPIFICRDASKHHPLS